jgi:hypothetical protein
VGAVAWSASMQYDTSFVETSVNSSSPMLHVFFMGAAATHWRAAFLVLQPIELFCLIAGLHLITRRLLKFLAESSSNRVLEIFSVFSAVLSVIGSLVGLAGNFVSAVSRVGLFYLSSDGLAAAVRNDTLAATSIMQHYCDSAAVGFISSSIQPFTEFLLLALNVCVMVMVTNATIRRMEIMLLLGAVNRVLDVNVIRQIKVVRGAVLLLILPRVFFAIFQASVYVSQSNDCACVGACSSTCSNPFYLIRNWLEFNPECRALLVLVSSPLLLSIIIWSTSAVVVQQRYIIHDEPETTFNQRAEPLIHSFIRSRGHRAERAAGASLLTPAVLESNSSTFVYSREPKAGASEISRCR